RRADRWRARLDGAPRQPPAGTLGPMRLAGGEAAHRAAVAETINRIDAGELFQANICLRLEGRLTGALAALVAPVLEQTDPWFGGWINDGAGHAILSASPELFVRRRDRAVATGPIKGTLPRGVCSVQSEYGDDPAIAGLLGSAKDRAEHVMIVDLMRNDFGRVCDYGSIAADDVPQVQAHAGVWHLVSTVRGRLHEAIGDGRLLRATFPPGSVTGAPKVQALRVIAAVEQSGREAYTGAHGLVSPVSGLEFAVTIRTLEVAGDAAWVGVGGGIVADSTPHGELHEALGKASALLAAAGSAIEPGGSPQRLGAAPPAADVEWLASRMPRPDARSGLLETVALRDGRLRRWSSHLARLRRSADALGYRWPPRFDEAVEMALAGGPRTGRLRIELLPGATVRAEVVPFAALPPDGVVLAPLVIPGGLGAHKWQDRRLVDGAQQRCGATALLLDASGEALEAAWANLWWEEDGGRLCTPHADGRLLPGIARGALLAAAPHRAAAVPAPTLARLAGRPLLLTSARGVTPARLAGTAPDDASWLRARQLADQFGALLDRTEDAA
ncbi:MAG: bifunctional chorismate-binding protein/class IV aminotransferase, partial [Patulibacter sp.]